MKVLKTRKAYGEKKKEAQTFIAGEATESRPTITHRTFHSHITRGVFLAGILTATTG